MNLRQQLITELMSFDKPNEFEKYIAKNSELFESLSEDELSMLEMMKKHCKRLCNAAPYSKKIIYEMVECGEVGLRSSIGELYNAFNAAENIFEKNRENSNK